MIGACDALNVPLVTLAHGVITGLYKNHKKNIIRISLWPWHQCNLLLG